MVESDKINPKHYKAQFKGFEIDVFDVCRAFGVIDPEQATMLRYVLRAGKKGDKVEQIQKAIQCGKRWIENITDE